MCDCTCQAQNGQIINLNTHPEVQGNISRQLIYTQVDSRNLSLLDPSSPRPECGSVNAYVFILGSVSVFVFLLVVSFLGQLFERYIIDKKATKSIKNGRKNTVWQRAQVISFDIQEWASGIVSAQSTVGKLLVALIFFLSIISLILYFIDTARPEMYRCKQLSDSVLFKIDFGTTIIFAFYREFRIKTILTIIF